MKNLPFHNMTLEEYTNSQINLLEENLLESSAATLAGIPGYKIVFTNIEGLKTMQVWTIKDDKAIYHYICCTRRRLWKGVADCTEDDWFIWNKITDYLTELIPMHKSLNNNEVLRNQTQKKKK